MNRKNHVQIISFLLLAAFYPVYVLQTTIKKHYGKHGKLRMFTQLTSRAREGPLTANVSVFPHLGFILDFELFFFFSAP